MKLIPCCVLILHVAAGVARAQTYDNLHIQLGAYAVNPDGGEKPIGVWRSTGPIVIGRLVTSTYSFGTTCDAFAVSSDASLIDNATTAWHIEMTPIRVVGDAVTFRLRWLRFAALQQQLDQIRLDSSKALRTPNEDIELTLRPGESWPVDTVQMPPGSKNSNGRPCGRVASIRVSVDAYPWVDEEERLVVADLWLVERLPNGSEVQRSQALSVRGLPNRPFAFYFDRLVDSGVPLDIYGRLLAHLESGGLAVSLDTRCRWGDPSPSRRYFGAQKSLKSELNLKPEEIVEVRLPLLGDEARPFAKREFSIRIRARQLR